MTTHRPRLRPTTRRLDVALRPFRTPVRGHAFAAAPPGVAAPHPGQPATLHREPENPADPLAVAVWTEQEGGWWRVGYLDRGVAARLAPRIDEGLRVEARIDGWVAEPRGRWRRPVVLLLPDGAQPFPPGARAEDDLGQGSGTEPADARRGSGPDHPLALAAEDAPSPRLWGRPPGVSVRPVRPGRRSRARG
jgi:hypothetical protein